MGKGFDGDYMFHVKQIGIKRAERRKKERIAREIKLINKLMENECVLKQELITTNTK